MDKAKIRQEMIQRRLDLDKDIYLSKSNLIIKEIEALEVFKQAKTVGIYVSMKQEVETIDFIQKWCQKKTICVPKVKGKIMDFHSICTVAELKRGNFGVLEPQNKDIMDKENIDILVIPMVAFDENNNRLGYGGGYYDRYLMDYQGYKIGVAFAFQRIASTFVERHDIPMDIVVFEKD